MSEHGRRFVIAGAGIAGLTLALALAKFGASVTVLERRPRIDEFGAGLQISPNARRILDRLGASRYLMPHMHLPGAIDIYPIWRKHRPLASLELGSVMQQRFGAPYGVMHRADLVEALHQACKRFATIDVLFGVKNVDFAHHAHGFTVLVEEADGKSRTIRPFAYIGADGVHSATRTDLVAGPKSRYGGYVAWRALIEIKDLPEAFNTANTSLLWGPDFHGVVYPLPHRGVANLVLLTRMSERRARQARDGRPFMAPNAMQRSPLFVHMLDRAPKLTPWPLYEVSTRVWHKGVVGLVGDAAHAMLPFQAQGAAMAIEDAAVLAPLLMTHAEPETAYQAYARIRLGRMARVARLSAWNGQIFHLGWPLGYLRDLAVFAQGRRAHLKRLGWIYSYDPAPEPQLAPARPFETM